MDVPPRAKALITGNKIGGRDGKKDTLKFYLRPFVPSLGNL